MKGSDKMKKGNKLLISGASLLFVGVAILVVLAVMLAVFRDNMTDDDEWILEPEQEAQAADMAGETISIPGMESMTFPAGEDTVAVRLYNPEGNPCYFEISIALQDGEEIYRSNMVSPGQELYEIELNEPLEAGEYEAVLQYETYSLDDEHTPMNGASVPITIYVTE